MKIKAVHFDIEAGKAVRVKTVGVTYGFGGKELVKAQPDFIIDKLSSLLKLI